MLILSQGKGKLEYHVPAHFDDQRPPFSYHHETHQTSITENSLASRLPIASSSPQFAGRIEDFEALMRRPSDPKRLEDYLYTDRPMLGLHIVSFIDATLITLSWSHILADAMGIKALFDAWSLVLQGREDQILPLHGVEADPMVTLGTRPTEPYQHAEKQLSSWQMMIFGLRYAFDQTFRRSKEETRVICLPAAYVQSLREAALADIKATNTGEGDGDTPFVSEGDVLCAWWTRHILSYTSQDLSQPVAIKMAFGLRWLLEKDMLPASSVYVGNAVMTVPAFMPARDILTKSLGSVASVLRKTLVALGTREQIEARQALERTIQDQTGNPGLFGDPWMHIVLCTNWTKGHFFDVDFSAAVTTEGRHLGGQQAGKPSYIQIHSSTPRFSLGSGFYILGKDAAGNYWLQSTLAKEYWPPKFEQVIN